MGGRKYRKFFACVCVCVCASVHLHWAEFFKSMKHNVWGCMWNRMGLSRHHRGSDIPSIHVSPQNTVGAPFVLLRSSHVWSAFPACHLLPLSLYCSPWREKKSLDCDLGPKDKATAPATEGPRANHLPRAPPLRLAHWHELDCNVNNGSQISYPFTFFF